MLTEEREVADYFEAAARRRTETPRATSNWVMTEVLRKLKDDERTLASTPVGPAALAGLVRPHRLNGTISGKIAKDVFERMWATGEEASAIVEREGLTQLSDESALEAVVAEVVAQSPGRGGELRGAGRRRPSGGSSARSCGAPAAGPTRSGSTDLLRRTLGEGSGERAGGDGAADEGV